MNTVPQIFLKETSLAAGTYLTEAPFIPAQARASPILKGLDGVQLPQLLGYNNSTAKGTAEVILTAPGGDPVTAASMAAAERLTPGKPIKYVVNTHHHADHAGGMRAYVAGGIPIITHESHKKYYEEQIFRNRC
jgi:glyoxylase-like metal-dependent hydrolase (beta-lactamase superfamily II)